MSVFVRASLQGPPKTSPGHVALHHMPGPPMNLQSLPPQRRPNISAGLTSNPNAARAQVSGATLPRPTPLGPSGQARFML